MKISQSFYKDANKHVGPGGCLYFMYLRYVKGLDTPPSDAMFMGLYFEWHLLGAVRSGKEPIFERGVKGQKLKPQLDLDIQIEEARALMTKMGVNLKDGQTQVRLETDTLVGHLDLVTNDYMNPSRQAIYDVKWTATKEDDRWRGWADPEEMEDIKIQARHYILLYKEVLGNYVPFYFFVFGKSGWVKVVKVQVMQESIELHLQQLEKARLHLEDFHGKGWPASPEYNKCRSCPFYKICDKKTLLPVAEIITA